METDRSAFMKIDLERERKDKYYTEKLLKEIHTLRNRKRLMNASDEYVIIQALSMYKKYQTRTLKNREAKNG